MSCVELPPLDIPQLPSPFSVTQSATLVVPQIPGLCCKLPIPPVPPIPISISASIMNPANTAALNKILKTVVAFINGLPFKCPLE